MFYNPTTCQTCIYKQAEFDERYFLCLSGSEQDTVPFFALYLLPTPSTQSNSTSLSLRPPPLSDKGSNDNLPLRPTVEPQSALVTSKTSPKVPPQVGNVPDESDDDLSYATPIGPALPKTPPRAPILLL